MFCRCLFCCNLIVIGVEWQRIACKAYDFAASVCKCLVWNLLCLVETRKVRTFCQMSLRGGIPQGSWLGRRLIFLILIDDFVLSYFLSNRRWLKISENCRYGWVLVKTHCRQLLTSCKTVGTLVERRPCLLVPCIVLLMFSDQTVVQVTCFNATSVPTIFSLCQL